MKSGWLLGATAVAGAALGMAGHGRGGQQPRPAPVRMATGAVAVRILLGRTDRAPSRWDGSLSVSGGELRRGWRGRGLRPGDELNRPGELAGQYR